MITWRRLSRDDLPLLATWLAQPHVHRWWYHDPSPAAVERDFGAATRGDDPSEDLVVLVDGTPVGLVQRCRVHDSAEDLAELSGLVDVHPAAVEVDYLVGDEQLIGRGLGPQLVAALVTDTWTTYADAPYVLASVVATNRRSWRALEKAGFRRVAEGDMAPENPVDPPLHYVYRIDRPEPAQPAASTPVSSCAAPTGLDSGDPRSRR